MILAERRHYKKSVRAKNELETTNCTHPLSLLSLRAINMKQFLSLFFSPFLYLTFLASPCLLSSFFPVFNPSFVPLNFILLSVSSPLFFPSTPSLVLFPSFLLLSSFFSLHQPLLRSSLPLSFFPILLHSLLSFVALLSSRQYRRGCLPARQSYTCWSNCVNMSRAFTRPCRRSTKPQGHTHEGNL